MVLHFWRVYCRMALIADLSVVNHDSDERGSEQGDQEEGEEERSPNEEEEEEEEEHAGVGTEGPPEEGEEIPHETDSGTKEAGKPSLAKDLALEELSLYKQSEGLLYTLPYDTYMKKEIYEMALQIMIENEVTKVFPGPAVSFFFFFSVCPYLKFMHFTRILYSLHISALSACISLRLAPRYLMPFIKLTLLACDLSSRLCKPSLARYRFCKEISSRHWTSFSWDYWCQWTLFCLYVCTFMLSMTEQSRHWYSMFYKDKSKRTKRAKKKKIFCHNPSSHDGNSEKFHCFRKPNKKSSRHLCWKVCGHRNLNSTKRFIIAHHQNFDASKNCKVSKVSPVFSRKLVEIIRPWPAVMCRDIFKNWQGFPSTCLQVESVEMVTGPWPGMSTGIFKDWKSSSAGRTCGNGHRSLTGDEYRYLQRLVDITCRKVLQSKNSLLTYCVLYLRA